MGVETLTDEHIERLLSCSKHVENAQAREKVEGKHRRRDYRVVSDDGQHRFSLFTRQSTKLTNGFSAGLLWHSKTGEDVMLMRCNGSDHPHVNALERQRFDPQTHIHRLTERYAQANRKVEGFAEATQAYRTLEGALHELVTRTCIAGLSTHPDVPDIADLFGDQA